MLIDWQGKGKHRTTDNALTFAPEHSHPDIRIPMDWRDLLTAFALYLVLEGVIPFINPAGFKRFMASMGEIEDATLRKFGVASMLAGVILLSVVR